jgi:hypothetical protein
MKSKGGAYASRFLVLLLIGLSFYSGLAQLEIIHIDPMSRLIVLLINGSLYGLGTLIIAPGLNRSAHNFVLRFLILTTVQMIALLSIVVALIYIQFDDFRTIVIHALAIFLFYMGFQSFLLVRYSRV